MDSTILIAFIALAFLIVILHIIFMKSYPYFIVEKNNGMQQVVSGVTTPLTSEIWNGTQRKNSSHITWDAGKFTISSSGIYSINCDIVLASSLSSGRRIVRILCSNGDQTSQTYDGVGYNIVCSVNGTFDLPSDTQVQVVIYQETGGNIQVESMNGVGKFAIYRLN